VKAFEAKSSSIVADSHVAGNTVGAVVGTALVDAVDITADAASVAVQGEGMKVDTSVTQADGLGPAYRWGGAPVVAESSEQRLCFDAESLPVPQPADVAAEGSSKEHQRQVRQTSGDTGRSETPSRDRGCQGPPPPGASTVPLPSSTGVLGAARPVSVNVPGEAALMEGSVGTLRHSPRGGGGPAPPPLPVPAAAATAAAAAKPAAGAAAVVPVELIFTMENLNYELLSSVGHMRKGFEAAVKSGIVQNLEGIAEKDVCLRLRPGSVIVAASISPASLALAAAAREKLSDSHTRGHIISGVVATVKGVEGIELAAGGKPIGCSQDVWLDGTKLLALTKAKLKVKIVGAAGLRNADYARKSDPYCVCRLPRQSDFSFQTKVVSGDLNPKWNGEFIVEDFVSRDKLDLTVFDQDALNQDDVLGRATLKSEDILPNGFQGALPLSGAGATGVVHVIIEVMNAPPQQSALTSAPGLSVQRAASGTGRPSAYGLDVRSAASATGGDGLRPSERRGHESPDVAPPPPPRPRPQGGRGVGAGAPGPTPSRPQPEDAPATQVLPETHPAFDAVAKGNMQELFNLVRNGELTLNQVNSKDVADSKGRTLLEYADKIHNMWAANFLRGLVLGPSRSDISPQQLEETELAAGSPDGEGYRLTYPGIPELIPCDRLCSFEPEISRGSDVDADLIDTEKMLFMVSPPLVPGLELNVDTGVIQGTPLEGSADCFHEVKLFVCSRGKIHEAVSYVRIETLAAPSGLMYPKVEKVFDLSNDGDGLPAVHGKPNTALFGVRALGQMLRSKPTVPKFQVSPSVRDSWAERYEIQPPLPKGMRLDTRSGSISGLPEKSARSAIFRSNFQVVAHNPVGSDTCTLWLEVIEGAWGLVCVKFLTVGVPEDDCPDDMSPDHQASEMGSIELDDDVSLVQADERGSRMNAKQYAERTPSSAKCPFCSTAYLRDSTFCRKCLRVRPEATEHGDATAVEGVQPRYARGALQAGWDLIVERCADVLDEFAIGMAVKESGGVGGTRIVRGMTVSMMAKQLRIGEDPSQLRRLVRTIEQNGSASGRLKAKGLELSVATEQAVNVGAAVVFLQPMKSTSQASRPSSREERRRGSAIGGSWAAGPALPPALELRGAHRQMWAQTVDNVKKARANSPVRLSRLKPLDDASGLCARQVGDEFARLLPSWRVKVESPVKGKSRPELLARWRCL